MGCTCNMRMSVWEHLLNIISLITINRHTHQNVGIIMYTVTSGFSGNMPRSLRNTTWPCSALRLCMCVCTCVRLCVRVHVCVCVRVCVCVCVCVWNCGDCNWQIPKKQINHTDKFGPVYERQMHLKNSTNKSANDMMDECHKKMDSQKSHEKRPLTVCFFLGPHYFFVRCFCSSRNLWISRRSGSRNNP